MSKVVIPLAAGDYLTECKYNVHEPAETRRRKLVRCVNKRGYKACVLRLNATAIRLKNTAPTTSNKIRADMKWLKERFRG